MPGCLKFPVHPGSVGSSTEESGKAGYQIKHFSLDDEIMKSVHDLLDRGGPIPPVHVQDIDVRGAKFLEGCLDGDVEGLCMTPGVIHLVGDFVLSPLEVGCILKMTSAH